MTGTWALQDAKIKTIGAPGDPKRRVLTERDTPAVYHKRGNGTSSPSAMDEQYKTCYGCPEADTWALQGPKKKATGAQEGPEHRVW